MRSFRLFRPAHLVALAALVLAPTAARADDTEEFLKPDNWEGLTAYWKVDAKAKTVTAVAEKDPGFNTFFCSKKTYTDFELTFKVRLKDGKGNSGVQIRSKVVDGEKEKGKFVVAGPQADIGAGYWGSLYGERFGGMMKQSDGEKVKKSVKGSEFNDYYIKVVGKKVTITVSGETMVDQEFDKLPADGIIAFQLHAGGPMTVEFKDIVFKNLAKK
jgi:hypothetical protein